MAYTTVDKSSSVFKTLLYVGNGSDAHSITGVGFKPDFVWTKNRSSATDNYLHDIVRGVQNAIRTNNTSATYATSINLQSFDADGFTLGTQDGLNQNGNNIVSWNFLAGGSQGSSNTAGSINTDYTSVNTSSGFSISQFTGTGSNATVGHGLGVAPSLVITKSLVATQEWCVGMDALGWGNYIFLNESSAQGSSSNYWQSTAPDENVFSIGTAGPTNSSSAMIAYCFAQKPGFSKFGKYYGNSDDNGPFVHCGFKPAMIILKETGSTSAWFMIDNARGDYGGNPNNRFLRPNTSDAETNSVWHKIDFLSNGFKIKDDDADINDAAYNYLYMAFAESPFVASNNIPNLAR